ncbi:hypothetical protein OF375_00310 [Ureaplasma miroungigenitalium]|uniref:hypothetical protein n=1 Tax=Ureaplasma miroungigenitalium TaxID=1042321 RepID=UPI0021E8F99E|nr:hypothetical protein [Ureaplasma miroungigenitalium]MCV3734037.1 hypothetical protein [Ureaplasma miroungigenitalium]
MFFGDQQNIISFSVNISVLVVVLVATIVFICRVKRKINNNSFIIAFIYYLVLWTPIMLVRSQNARLQVHLEEYHLMWIVMCAYGFVGIFIRIFADYLYYLVRYRKAFLMFALIAVIASFIPILIKVDTIGNIIQSVGVGIAASCIGTYQLLFKEQYVKDRTFLSVSLLSIPPLLASFITTPIRSLISVWSNDRIHHVINFDAVRVYWIIATIFFVIAFVLWFFIKEVRGVGLIRQHNMRYKSKKLNFLGFILIALSGLLILMIKFSNSGSIATIHIMILDKHRPENALFYKSYLSLIHNFFQLVASMFLLHYLVKKIAIHKIIFMGLFLFAIYHSVIIFITSPIAFMSVHFINGLAYGIVYNGLISIVLKIHLDNKKITTMGIYQSILSIGITLAGFISNYVKFGFNNHQKTYNDFFDHNLNYNLVMIASLVLSGIFLLGGYYLTKKNAFEFKRPRFQYAYTKGL